MKKPSPTEAALAKLHAVKDDPEGGRAVIAHALEGSKGPVIALAAALIAEAELEGFGPALIAAFDRLLPLKNDPGCKGKIAIVHALLKSEAGDAALFLKAARLRQMEPVWGGTVDTAPELRGNAGLGLLRTRHPMGPIVLAELLADEEAAARVAAARSLVELEASAALPLLRFKIAIGDKAPDVIGACIGSMIEIEPVLAFPIAAELLSGKRGGEAEAIAVALGESKRAEAVPILKDHAERTDAAGRAVAFVALAILRDEAATAHLLEVVRTGAAGPATDAVHALAHFRHDARIRAPALAAAEARNDGVGRLAREAFERP